MANVAEFNDSNFESEVLKSAIPVLVDFWAPWCGPCRQLAPLVEELAKDYSGSIKVGKMDVDSSPIMASKYSVFSIPTLMVFKNGQVANTFVGLQPKTRLQQALDAAK